MRVTDKVELVMSGFCKDCPCADLSVHDIDFSDGVKWFVHCHHEVACGRMFDLLYREERNETNEK